MRQVTARNTPTVINAVFYLRNFWDGRAQQPVQRRDAVWRRRRARHVLVGDGSALVHRAGSPGPSSLASQAVGPPLNAVEMSFDGRAWAHLGRKMLSLPPLARQSVALDDSVLGPFANESSPACAPRRAIAR